MTVVPSGYLIRDARLQDVESCSQLDHSYLSDYVWQMTTQNTASQTMTSFRRERLPRPVHHVHRASMARMTFALEATQCFLVVTERVQNTVWGYLTMRSDRASGIATVQDVVVDSPYRRHGIGRRLLSIARQWALEHEHHQMLVEVDTKNYPMIQMVQGQGFIFCGYNDQYFLNGDIAVFWGQSLR